ncbi:anti-sigma factor family protein [Streptomyces sp. NPDC096319]|uniref:anti-sigma factor family protein n=1 Tax=Streptomyces sp. NPDC096319 TaxID=3366084 RepID=UPI003816DF7E
MDCERLRDAGAELALGVLPARERAEAVAHLDRCPECRAYVERLTAVGDALLGLLPGAEPPVGFESRAVRAMGPAGAGRARAAGAGPAGAAGAAPVAPDATPDAVPDAVPPVAPAAVPPRAAPVAARRRIRARRFRFAVAGAAAALAFGFGGWAVGTVVEGSPAVVAPALGVREAALVAAGPAGGGREVGRIYAHPADATGGNGWVYMSVDLGDGPSAEGPVRCLLVRADGSVVPLGSFPVTSGYGYWGAPAPVDPGTVTGARLLAADGTLLATAHFTGADGAASGAATAG